MTRDKAIEEVKNYENYPNGLSKECRDYIVKALEQVPNSLENPNLSENPISSTTKNGISNKSIIYKAKESKEIQEDLDKLSELNEPTTKNDLALIHTEGLDEEIRCTMCTNSMKSDRGCDGSCVVNSAMYKNVMDAIEKRIQPTTKNDLGVKLISKEDALDCVNWGYSFSDIYKKISDLPPVTPIRPKGHWICDGKGRSFADYHCSECGLKLALCGQDIKQRQDSGYSLFCGGCGSDNREVKKV